MDEVKYTSLESQLGNAPCLCEDTEEMFWLRESDDYGSRVQLGNLLSGQYRFREALDAYCFAKKIRDDDPMLYIRLGGASLTLWRFDEAKKPMIKAALSAATGSLLHIKWACGIICKEIMGKRQIISLKFCLAGMK